MSSVSSVTTRITGMASGLDTDAIVEDLMKASQTELDGLEQEKQKLEWKQEAYKDITQKLYDFQQKYYTSSSSWLDGVSNVTAKYDSDYISVTTSATSATGDICIKDIVSVASAAKLVSSTSVSADPKIEINSSNLSNLTGKSIVIDFNGTQKQLTFSQTEYVDSAAVQSDLQSLINSAFGSGRMTVSLNGDTLSLNAQNSTVTLKTPTDGTDPSSVLTYGSYTSNKVDLDVSLNSAGLAADPGTDIAFSINGTSFSFTSSDSLNGIMEKINSSTAGVKMTYSKLTDKFTLTSTVTGSTSDVNVSDTTGTLMNSLFGTGVKTNGTDAIVKLSTSGSFDDVITVTRSTNTIDVDGTIITVKNEAANEAEENVNISLCYDNDAIIEKIKTFVTDYNSLLSSITSKTSEEYDKDYKPLTDDEKDAMSDDEVSRWEKKAKTGLLANDSYLTKIATELRSCFYTQVSSLGDSSSYVGLLSQIGISTSVYSDKGKLTIDETALKKAINSDPAKIVALFTQKSDKSYSLYSTSENKQERFNESGVFHRLSDILSNNLSAVGQKGTLINLVGSPTATYTGNSDYAKKIDDKQNEIKEKEADMAKEEESYYRKFTAMETAMDKLNSQSSWISSMLGGSAT